jgi:hypothetical protein
MESFWKCQHILGILDKFQKLNCIWAVAHKCNPSTQEAQAGGSWAQGLYNKTLSQNINKEKLEKYFLMLSIIIIFT